MTELKWDKEYSVGIREIDEQHKKFIKIINKLNFALINKELDEKLSEILEDLIEYAGYHFYTEESYFEKFGYELTEEHKMQHHSFSEKIREFKIKMNKNKVEISFDLIEFLENWLIGHIMGSDKKYTECFHDHDLY